jgi:hypothetical protein
MACNDPEEKKSIWWHPPSSTGTVSWTVEWIDVKIPKSTIEETSNKTGDSFSIQEPEPVVAPGDCLRIAIIGSAGRGKYASLVTRDLYIAMLEDAKHLVQKYRTHPLTGEVRPVCLVSGGAAFSDHLAVSLYLGDHVDRLELKLPCMFNNATRCFVENSTGRTANYYHREFCQYTASRSSSSLEQLGKIVEESRTSEQIDVSMYSGFKARNLAVGDVDILICYHWGSQDFPPRGSGSRHCWSNSRALVKTFRDLGQLRETLS